MYVFSKIFSAQHFRMLETVLLSPPPPRILHTRYTAVIEGREQKVDWSLVKRPGCEADHYLYLVPRLRMHGGITPFPQYFFMARWIAKHRHNFNLPYTPSWRGN
jgi:hypothetical protein